MTDAEIFVEPRTADERTEPLKDLLTELGFSTRIRALPTRRSGEALTWVALVVLPLTAFVGGLGSHLAQDAYQALKHAVGSLRDRDRRGTDPRVEPPPLVVQDPTTGLQIVLPPDLPEDGYRKLLALDLSTFRLGPLRYDAAAGRWRSDLDEAAR